MKNKNVSLKRTLGLPLVVFFGIAYMAPGVPLVIYGEAANLSQGMVTGIYVILLLGMLFTVNSYAKMVKAFPIAGSAYTYTQKGINPNVGFLVGWTILLDYYFSPIFNAVVVGVFYASAFPSTSSAFWIVLFIVVITILSLFGINFSSNLNAILVLFQLLVVILFAALSIKDILGGAGAGTLFSFAPFFNPDSGFTNITSAISLIYITFLGFDLVTTLAEETKKPIKTIPRALYIIVFFGGTMGITLTYLAYMLRPDLSSFQDIDSAAYELVFQIGGNLLSALFLAATVIVASSASTIASYTSASRILYTMGREGVLPNKIFGYLSPKFRVPTYNILIIGALSLLAVFFDLNTASLFIAFGVTFAFTFVNISVISHYYIKKKERSIKGTISYLIIPLIGALFTVFIFFQLGGYAILIGSIWVIIGFVYLMYITKMFKYDPPEIDDKDID